MGETDGLALHCVRHSRLVSRRIEQSLATRPAKTLSAAHPGHTPTEASEAITSEAVQFQESGSCLWRLVSTRRDEIIRYSLPDARQARS